MDEFKSLITIIEQLLGPEGCPWDREQTLNTMRHFLIEETYEVIEAINLNENHQIEEELGDLFFNVVFLCKLAEKEKRFSLQDVLLHISTKLIRRHPHVFGNAASLKTSEDVLKQWADIKQTEKEKKRENPEYSTVEDIPKAMPALSRAQKMAKKFAKLSFVPRHVESNDPEDQAGDKLWKDVQDLTLRNIQAEEALRKRLAQLEGEFKAWEKSSQDMI